MYTKSNLFTMFVCGMLSMATIVHIRDGKWDNVIINVVLLLLNIGMFIGSTKSKNKI